LTEIILKLWACQFKKEETTFGSIGNGYDNLQAKFQLDILYYSGDMAIVNVLIS